MKKLLTLCFIVILALCFTLPSIALSVPPYTPNPYKPESLYAYNKLLQSVDVPEGFVYYQDISFLGEFDKFEFVQGNLEWSYYRYTLRTYQNEEGEVNGEYYVGNTFTVDIWHEKKNYSLPQITTPKDQILSSEDLTVYYSGGSTPGWEIGTYGDPDTGILGLMLQSGEEDLTTFESEIVRNSLTFSPSGRDGFANFYAERKGTSVEYSPFGELYQQWYFEDHRDEMVSTIVSSLLRRDYEKQYKEVFESYVDLVSGPQNPRYALDLNDFSYLGTLKSYQFDEGSNYETGEFRFATPDPEIDIVLTIKDLDPSADATEQNGTTEIPEGPDLRGERFCRKYSFGEVVFDEKEIVVNNYSVNKTMTLRTFPESALANYPMYYDGGGFLSLLLSAENNEYCSEYFVRSLGWATGNPYYTFPQSSSGATNTSVSDTALDEGMTTDSNPVTDTANAEDATGTAGNSATTDPTPSTDGTDSPAVSTDTAPTSSVTATPAEPTPFPWVWVAVPAAAVLVGGGLAAAVVLLRKKKKQEF